MEDGVVKPSNKGAGSPVASTSKLGTQSSDSPSKEDVKPDIKPDLKRSASPDAKGKGKAPPEEAQDVKQDPGGDDPLKEEDKGDPEEEILLATVPKANINGVKYAGGIRTLKEGMSLELRRDPYNVSDKNAIEVRHPRGQRVGYIAKILAGRLAPMLKERKITLEGTAGPVPSNITGVLSVPMALEIWGKRKIANDPRLDWAFPDRVKKLAEAAAQREALAQAKLKAEEEDQAKAKKKGGKGKGGGGGPGSDGPEPDLVMTQSVLLENKGRPAHDLLGDLFKEGVNDPAHLPTHPCPPGRKDGTMRSNLMEFQKQGLAWMIKMEHPRLPKSPEDPPVQMWVMKKDVMNETFWYNVGTETSQREKPILKRGGILADEMGLGKTMQTISLICTDDTGEGVLDKPEEPDERFDDMTLIVCPLSVASNWTDQLQQHVGKKRLKWHFYHGEGRDLSKKELREYDVVITTYQTLIGGIEPDLKKPKPANIDEEMEIDQPPLAKKQKKKDAVKDGTLHAIKWRRVVLDEGHLIKNPKAKMSRACADLKAERRWILTGTPIVNAAADLGAMISFLRICKPLDDADVWKRYVAKAQNEEATSKLLRAVVLSTTLRRTKDMVDASGQPLVKLPEVSFYQNKVKLPPAVRQLYDEIDKVAKGIVTDFLRAGTVKANYTYVLVVLLRLRQIACDPLMCPADFIEEIRDTTLRDHLNSEFAKASSGVVDINNPDQLRELRALLDELADEGCEACQNLPVEPRITICRHIFCLSCIESAVDAQGHCPRCTNPLSLREVVGPKERSVSPSTTRSSSVAASSRQGSVALGERTAKTAELIRLLKGTPPGIKSLVFSQWTTHLDRIEAALNEEGISTCRFDGSMRQDKREEVIKSFTTPNKVAVAGDKTDKKSPMVMLLSLKAGALGLNLTVASQVFLMDPWWQAAIEQQAIDRVNRIGQTQKVRVFQIVAEDTVEDRVLKVQEKKDALIAQAFSGNRNAPRGREKIDARMHDIADIFGL
ncbi:hypothetical protein JCM5296_002912 [Sporobolomyces johnsonii]